MHRFKVGRVVLSEMMVVTTGYLSRSCLSLAIYSSSLGISLFVTIPCQP